MLQDAATVHDSLSNRDDINHGSVLIFSIFGLCAMFLLCGSVNKSSAALTMLINHKDHQLFYL